LKEDNLFEDLSNEAFVGYLRSALHYLYDPVQLRRSPLINLFQLREAFDPSGALQQMLTEAIEQMKPGESEPPLSYAWRIYDFLNLRYLRQHSREVVATQLGISDRQLRREQRLSLEALAQYFYRNNHLVNLQGSGRPAEGTASLIEEEEQALNAELAWLQNLDQEQPGALGDALETVRDLAQPLAELCQVTLKVQIDEGIHDFPVTQLVIRNILLTILSIAIPRARQKPVELLATEQQGKIELRITCDGTSVHNEPFSEQENASIETVRQLVAFYGAELEIPKQAQGFSVILSIAHPQQIPILVIDDNSDWLELLKRYAQGSQYHVIGSREPENAVGLVEKVQPELIFVDVMMPNIDGWQVISELRNNQVYGHIPIVVCTILPLKGLALSLGVNGFLQKPVTQEQFLKTVDQLVRKRED
jgi:CheY-like chemotaxis protein